MKNAAGEANMTVITIILIATVLLLGTVVISSMSNNTKKSSSCQACGGVWVSGSCKDAATKTTTINYTSCMNG